MIALAGGAIGDMKCYYCEEQEAVTIRFGKHACDDCAEAEVRTLNLRIHSGTEEEKARFLKLSLSAFKLARRG